MALTKWGGYCAVLSRLPTCWTLKRPWSRAAVRVLREWTFPYAFVENPFAWATTDINQLALADGIRPGGGLPHPSPTQDPPNGQFWAQNGQERSCPKRILDGPFGKVYGACLGSLGPFSAAERLSKPNFCPSALLGAIRPQVGGGLTPKMANFGPKSCKKKLCPKNVPRPFWEGKPIAVALTHTSRDCKPTG